IEPAFAQSPLLPWHLARGAKIVREEGWQIVQEYTRKEENEPTQTGLALIDVSSGAKLSILGKGVAEFTNALTNGVPLPPRAVLPLQTSQAVLVCRLRQDHLLVLSLQPGGESLRAYLERVPGAEHVVCTDVTSGYAGMALSGACAVDVLRSLTALDLSPSS